MRFKPNWLLTVSTASMRSCSNRKVRRFTSRLYRHLLRHLDLAGRLCPASVWNQRIGREVLSASVEASPVLGVNFGLDSVMTFHQRTAGFA